MKRLLFASLALCLVAGLLPAAAQSTADGPSVQANGFSQAIDVTDDHVFAGEPNNLHTPGRVYVLGQEDGEWTQQTHLEAEDGEVGDGFGSALHVQDNVVAVGAPSAGAAYVFERQDGTWRQTSRLAPPEADSASSFGQSVRFDGDRLFVGAGASERAEEDGAGTVYVYEQAEGEWAESTTISSGVVPAGGGFGSALATSADQLLVSAPAHRSGVVVAFEWVEGEGWGEKQLLEAGVGSGSRFGTSLRRGDDGEVLVGAPRALDATGTVRIFTYEDGEWNETGALLPFDGTARHLFGRAIVHDGTDLWVGAPGANKGTGALYRFQRDEDAWRNAERISYPAAEERSQLGATLAASGGAVAVGLPGDDYGAGTLGVYSLENEEWSTATPFAPNKDDVLASMTGETRECAETDGAVGTFECKGVDLHAFLPINDIGGDRGIELNDVWGWTDPETGTEYALVGRTDGTAFVDVSNPTNPVYVGELPLTDGARVNSWRDIKVYEDHAYVVADNAGEHGMQIFDLAQLRDVEPADMPVTFEETALYERINSAHNMVINKETGYGYIVGSSGGGETCGGGLHMVNLENPTEPVFEGCFADASTGRAGTGYSHDAECVIYEGPDEEYQGREICVGYNETAISIADVTNKDNPQAISTASYPDHAYVHQGWFTEDQRYIYQNDELDELQGKVARTRTLVWDVTDLDNPTLVNEHLFSVESTDHNLYVKGSTMYQSNYKSGLRILDVSDPENPEEYAYFNTFPPNNENGFQGTWSNYPFFESGTIVVSSIGEGLFVLEESQKQEL